MIKEIRVFTDAVIDKMVKDAEQRLDRLDKHNGKRPSAQNRRIAQKMASQMIIMWKTDEIFAEMAKECGKK